MSEKPIGRPTLYKEEFCEQIVEYAKEGLFLSEIAEKFEVDVWTMKNWSKIHFTFSRAYARAKSIIMSKIERNMYEKNGEKFFNPRSNEFLLEQMNRQSKQAAVGVDNFSADKLEQSVAALLKAVEEEKIRADEFSQLMNGLITAQNILNADKALQKLEQIEEKK